MKPWIMSCMQFCFSLPSFESVSNPVHSLFSYHIIVFLIHGEKKERNIYIFYQTYQVLLVIDILFYV